MRFLFVAPIPFFHERGACIRSLNMVTALSDMGHHIDMITYPVGREVSIKNLNIIRVQTRHKPPLKAKMTAKRVVVDYLLYKAAQRLMKKNSYDCIIGKTPMGRLIGRKLKEQFGVPLISDVVESTLGVVDLYTKKKTFGGKYASKIIRLAMNPLTRQFMRRMEIRNYQASDVIIANWDLVKEELDRETRRESILLYDMVPSHLVGHTTKRPGKEVTLLYTGALSPQQGVDVYIQMFEHLRHKNVKLRIVGPINKSYVDMVHQRGLDHVVDFVGEIPFDELSHYLKSADILLSAYNTGGKNATVKLLTYLFQKRPIIASDTPQYRQIVSDDTVFLTAPDPKSFARQIDYILDHPHIAQKKAAHALSYAKKKFSKDTYYKTMKRIVQTATRSAR